MNKRPNALQKFLHRFAMLKPVSAFLAKTLHFFDRMAFALTGGKFGFAELLGLPMLELTSVGAKSGQPRTMPLAAYREGDSFALIGSNFGRRNHPGWYYNLKANPRCIVRVGGEKQDCIARELFGQERENYWRIAVSYYAGYEKYRERASHRQIPVFLLEPVKELPR